MFNVLIVDDDRDARALLDVYLKKFGYNVLHASNGIDALSLIKQKDISIVLMDWMK